MEDLRFSVLEVEGHGNRKPKRRAWKLIARHGAMLGHPLTTTTPVNPFSRCFVKWWCTVTKYIWWKCPANTSHSLLLAEEGMRLQRYDLAPLLQCNATPNSPGPRARSLRRTVLTQTFSLDPLQPSKAIDPRSLIDVQCTVHQNDEGPHFASGCLWLFQRFAAVRASFRGLHCLRTPLDLKPFQPQNPPKTHRVGTAISLSAIAGLGEPIQHAFPTATIY